MKLFNYSSEYLYSIGSKLIDFTYNEKQSKLSLMTTASKPRKLKDQELEANLERVHKDLYETALKFEERDIHNTIVFFGSSQICSWEDAQKNMREVEMLFEESATRTPKLWDLLDRANNIVHMSRYFDAAVELSMELAKWSKRLKGRKKNEFVICSGGGPGIMEATNKGAYLAGARSIGLTIDISEEQGRNYYITPELKYSFTYFFLRKFWFFHYARAIIVFPGGMGTLDEFFEIMTLLKTKKASSDIPIVLFGSEYWKGVINFQIMTRFNTIEDKDLEFFQYADTVEEAFAIITKRLKDFPVNKSAPLK